MQEVYVGWDPMMMIVEPSTRFTTLTVALVVVWVVGLAKLLRVWRGAPPFLVRRRFGDSTYLQSLEEVRISVTQWIGLTFFATGFFLVLAIPAIWDLREKGVSVHFPVRELSAGLGEGLITAWGLFLLRWHVIRRISALSRP